MGDLRAVMDRKQKENQGLVRKVGDIEEEMKNVEIRLKSTGNEL